MNVKKSLLMSFCFLLVLNCIAQKDKNVVILETIDKSEIRANYYCEIVKDKLMKAIANSSTYKITFRGDLVELTKEWDFADNGYISKAQLDSLKKKNGNIDAADYLCYSEISRNPDKPKYRIRARLINAYSGEIIHPVDITVHASESAITQGSIELAEELMKDNALANIINKPWPIGNWEWEDAGKHFLLSENGTGYITEYNKKINENLKWTLSENGNVLEILVTNSTFEDIYNSWYGSKEISIQDAKIMNNRFGTYSEKFLFQNFAKGDTTIDGIFKFLDKESKDKEDEKKIKCVLINIPTEKH